MTDFTPPRYTLEPKPEDDRRLFYVYITADVNDAAYVTTNEIFNHEWFVKYIPELKKLMTEYNGRHQLESFPNELDLDLPRDQFSEIAHTLVSVHIEYVDEHSRVYNVKLN